MECIQTTNPNGTLNTETRSIGKENQDIKTRETMYEVLLTIPRVVRSEGGVVNRGTKIVRLENVRVRRLYTCNHCRVRSSLVSEALRI